MINKKVLRAIKDLAIGIDHDLAFGGKSKGNRHLLRVVKIAKFLARKVGADESVVEAGAWLHDTALPSGNDYGYLRNKKIVTDLIKHMELSRDEVRSIAECVASHEGTIIPKSLEAKTVHDADVLDKTGLLGIIRHTWKMTNSSQLVHGRIDDVDVRRVLDHIEWRRARLQTLLARKMAKSLVTSIDNNKLKSLITIISGLAHKGVITEKIAMVLVPRLSREQNRILREQLNLSYLRRFK